MSIQFRDFFPDVKKRGWLNTEFVSLQELLVHANEWIAENNVRVLNVETVVLPNIQDSEETTEMSIRTSSEMSNYWYQFVRVWYEA